MEPGETGGPAITGYQLRIRKGNQWVDEATLGNVLTYTDRNLVSGTKYYYIVRAINSQGAGLWSGYKAGTPTAAFPDAPVLTATATGLKVIRLMWTVPNDNGMGITGYELQRWNPAADPAAWDTETNLLGTDNNKVLHLDSELDPGKPYHYRIRALPQPGGDDDAGWSMIKSDTTDAGAPSRPVLTAMADGSTAIDLSWDAPLANGSAIHPLRVGEVGHDQPPVGDRPQQPAVDADELRAQRAYGGDALRLPRARGEPGG